MALIVNGSSVDPDNLPLEINVRLQAPLAPNARILIYRNSTLVGAGLPTEDSTLYSITDPSLDAFEERSYTAVYQKSSGAPVYQQPSNPSPQSSDNLTVSMTVPPDSNWTVGKTVTVTVTVTNNSEEAIFLGKGLTFDASSANAGTSQHYSTVPAGESEQFDVDVIILEFQEIRFKAWANINKPFEYVETDPFVVSLEPPNWTVSSTSSIPYGVTVVPANSTDIQVISTYREHTSAGASVDNMYREYNETGTHGTVFGARYVNLSTVPAKFTPDIWTLTENDYPGADHPMSVIDGGGSIIPPGTRILIHDFPEPGLTKELTLTEIDQANNADEPLNWTFIEGSSSYEIILPPSSTLTTWLYKNTLWSDPSLNNTVFRASVSDVTPNESNSSDNASEVSRGVYGEETTSADLIAQSMINSSVSSGDAESLRVLIYNDGPESGSGSFLKLAGDLFSNSFTISGVTATFSGGAYVHDATSGEILAGTKVYAPGPELSSFFTQTFSIDGYEISSLPAAGSVEFEITGTYETAGNVSLIIEAVPASTVIDSNLANNEQTINVTVAEAPATPSINFAEWSGSATATEVTIVVNEALPVDIEGTEYARISVKGPAEYFLQRRGEDSGDSYVQCLADDVPNQSYSMRLSGPFNNRNGDKTYSIGIDFSNLSPQPQTTSGDPIFANLGFSNFYVFLTWQLVGDVYQDGTVSTGPVYINLIEDGITIQTLTINIVD